MKSTSTSSRRIGATGLCAIKSKAQAFKTRAFGGAAPAPSSPIIVRMHPDVWQGLPLFREPDHVNRRRVSRRSACAACQRGLEFPDRHIARPANVLERNTGLGFAARRMGGAERYPSIAFYGDDGFRRLNPSYVLNLYGSFAASVDAKTDSVDNKTG